MQKKEITIGAYGLHQYNVHGVIYMPDNGYANKVIHVVHGMTEHMGRYEQFAKDLTDYGVAVAGFDLRGHGKNSGSPECASFISGQKLETDYGWERSVDDIRQQKDVIKKYLPKAEYYLLGFSLGSFLVRECLNTVNMGKINGVILVGTGYQPSIVTGIMRLIAKSQIAKADVGGTTNLIRTLAFSTYNKEFDCDGNGCGMEWLCSDTEQLALYMQDQLVRPDIAADLFYEMLGGMHRTNKKKQSKYINNIKYAPVLLISGSDDAVGSMGKGIDDVAKVLRINGFNSVKKLVLKKARHDVFHEYSNGAYDRMMTHLVSWIGAEEQF